MATFLRWTILHLPWKKGRFSRFWAKWRGQEHDHYHAMHDTEKTSGELRINGNDVTAKKALCEKISELFFRIPRSTVNSRWRKTSSSIAIFTACRNRSQWPHWIRSSIGRFIGLEKSHGRRLSGGMKRRAEIARAGAFSQGPLSRRAHNRPGPQTRANVWSISILCKTKDITIFLTTHYMDEAEICGTVAIIDHGKSWRSIRPII